MKVELSLYYKIIVKTTITHDNREKKQKKPIITTINFDFFIVAGFLRDNTQHQIVKIDMIILIIVTNMDNIYIIYGGQPRFTVSTMPKFTYISFISPCHEK